MNSYRVCRCGDAFYPRRTSHKLCNRCWSERQQASRPDLVDVLRSAVSFVQPDHNADRQDEATRLTQDLLGLLEQEKRR